MTLNTRAVTAARARLSPIHDIALAAKSARYSGTAKTSPKVAGRSAAGFGGVTGDLRSMGERIDTTERKDDI